VIAPSPKLYLASHHTELRWAVTARRLARLNRDDIDLNHSNLYSLLRVDDALAEAHILRQRQRESISLRRRSSREPGRTG
jgi:hypothetical protein